MDSNPDDLSVLMAYAEANMRKGSRLEALKIYQKMVRMQPESVNVRMALAKIYISMEHFQDALGELQQIFSKEPENIEAHLLLRKIFRVYKVPEALAESFQPHFDFMAPYSKVRIIKKQYELEKKKFQRLVDDYDSQLQDEKSNPILLYNRQKAFERITAADEAFEDLMALVNPEELVEEETGEISLPEESLEPSPEISPQDGGVSSEESEEVPEPAMLEIPPEEERDIVGEEEESSVLVDFPSEEITGVPIEDMYDVEANPVEERNNAPVETIEMPLDQKVLSGPWEDEGEEISSGEIALAQAKITSVRKSYFEEIRNPLVDILDAITKSRGVTSAMLLESGGYVIQQSGSESMDADQMLNLLQKGVTPLVSWRSEVSGEERSLLFWVLEFESALLVVQPQVKDVYLMVLGRKGANLGSMKFSIERNTAELLNLLEGAPA